jgi:hypothetical protein
MRFFVQSFLARCSGLPSADATTDFRDEKDGVFVADLPRSRHRKAWL